MIVHKMAEQAKAEADRSNDAANEGEAATLTMERAKTLEKHSSKKLVRRADCKSEMRSQSTAFTLQAAVSRRFPTLERL